MQSRSPRAPSSHAVLPLLTRRTGRWSCVRECVPDETGGAVRRLSARRGMSQAAALMLRLAAVLSPTLAVVIPTSMLIRPEALIPPSPRS